MGKYATRMCIAVLVSAVPILGCQTAMSASKSKTTDTPPAGADKQATSAANARNTNFVRRIHVTLAKEAEPEFLRVINAKRITEDEVRTIRRLSHEKRAVLERIAGHLSTDYKMLNNHNYRYDEATKTIFDLTGPTTDTNATGTATAVPKDTAPAVGSKRVHMVLDNKEEADKFVQLSNARQLTATVLRVLSLLAQEKEAALKQMDGIVLEKFGMSRDRGYEYDAGTRTLYELIPVPTGAGKSVTK